MIKFIIKIKSLCFITDHNLKEMDVIEFPAEDTEQYNKLIRACYFIKHADFEVAESENFGKWKCNVCLQDVFILQKAGTGLTSLVRHVKSKHLDHRSVRITYMAQASFF